MDIIIFVILYCQAFFARLGVQQIGGRTLGHYQITNLLGKGGMGEVYRAKDQKLGRDVAIKVLPDEFAKDAHRVARFQREAKVLASLNHPNIAAIYGPEEHGPYEIIEERRINEKHVRGSPIPAF